MNQSNINIGIIGATGYVGMELCRLLSNHPVFNITTLCSRSYEGQIFSDVYPAFRGILDIELTTPDIDILSTTCDVVITALPHGVAAKFVPQLLAKGLTVLDHSGDFRFENVATYQAAYNLEHPRADLLKEAVYGLPELYRDRLRDTELISNPGCYPTAAILAAAPLAKQALIDTRFPLIIDAVSGTSGAGRQDKAAYGVAEMGKNFKAYAVSGHRHIPEMEEKLSLLSGTSLPIAFTPHLLPIARGMMATLYIHPSESFVADLNEEPEQLRNLYRKYYENDPFIRIMPNGHVPEIAAVAGTNFCDIAAVYDRPSGLIKVLSAIDNLGKGACSQAIQALNVRFSLPEQDGLRTVAQTL